MVNVCVDPEVFEIEDGQLTFVPGAFGARAAVVYRTGGTFKKDQYPGIARVLVQVQAAGGGSAGAAAGAGNSVARAGGAGGGYGEAVIDVDELAAEEPVKVGRGGTGGKGNTRGKKGGDSGFGKHITAVGGAGSTAAMESGKAPVCYSGTAGPEAGKGDGWNAGGGAGGGCLRLTGNQAQSGEGGTAMMGMEGQPRASSAGPAGRGYGAGAAGAMTRDGASVNGAAGQDGLVVVWVFAG